MMKWREVQEFVRRHQGIGHFIILLGGYFGGEGTMKFLLPNVTAILMGSWGMSKGTNLTWGGSIRPHGSFFDLEGDHVRRYLWASQFLRSLKVLDVGCGYGYGSNFLANGIAREVVAMDSDKSAIEFASKNYRMKNLIFKAGDATNLDFESESFDAVVSFEVIEHLRQYELFMEMIRNVLKPSGLFLISTPNRNYTERFHINGLPMNPHHVKEFYPAEIEVMLARFFEVVGVFYERSLRGEEESAGRGFKYQVIRMIPRRVGAIIPFSVKSAFQKNRLKWTDYEIVSVSSIGELTERIPVQLYHCRRSSTA